MSKLVTNSVAATGKVTWEAGLPPVRLWLRAGPDGVLVAVWDAVPELPPQPRQAGELEEIGQGLWIVREVSTRCDYLPPAPPGGKVTRALVASP